MTEVQYWLEMQGVFCLTAGLLILSVLLALGAAELIYQISIRRERRRNRDDG